MTQRESNIIFALPTFMTVACQATPPPMGLRGVEKKVGMSTRAHRWWAWPVEELRSHIDDAGRDAHVIPRGPMGVHL